jgi:hypothetical protein
MDQAQPGRERWGQRAAKYLLRTRLLGWALSAAIVAMAIFIVYDAVVQGPAYRLVLACVIAAFLWWRSCRDAARAKTR